ncbi:alpha/beta hydrolase [Euzebya rosea]|uniref:alpha/beta hydrolase n=1 Tax=Euzebya rosea TaxID=2052804 RepID=UPI000D3E9A1E|nr:alpha/beta fold hydrolase [Euzebya rosea]
MTSPPDRRRDVDRQAVLAAKRREDRRAWHRIAEVRGWTGGHRAPHRTVALTTDDGVRLAGTWLPGPRREDTAIVVVHGFAAHRRKPAYAFLADHLAATNHVLAIDLRGHGGSSGRSTLGADEWRDVHAAVDTLKGRGHQRVVVVGLSLGGTATAHALAKGLDVDAAVLVSSSARHWDLSLPGMVTLDSLWRSPLKRRVWQSIAGFRMVPPDRIPPYGDPVDLVADTDVPLLIVHGADDAYFAPGHADELAEAAGGHVVVWHEPVGFGHAEDGLTPAFCARLAEAVGRVVSEGRFPAR